MLCMSIQEVLDATAATLLAGPHDGTITRVTIDSRTVEENSCFVAFKGERVDGNNFAAQACKKASCVVITGDVSDELCHLAQTQDCALLRADADDGEEFLLRLSAAWRQKNPQWIVVGVTGSVGKTTTKDMLACGLAASLRVHKTAGNYNNLIGLPLTLLAADPKDEVVIAEMGMNHKGELSRLTQAARPNLAVITNIGTSHIGNLGSRENIARAKAEILEGMTAAPSCVSNAQNNISDAFSKSESKPKIEPKIKTAPCLVLCDDNDFAQLINDEYAQPQGIELVSVGTHASSAVQAHDIQLDADGKPNFTLVFKDGWQQSVQLETPGRHVINDFLLALAIIDRLGQDRKQAVNAIEHMPQTHMRLELVKVPGKPRIIDDSYNASPSSVAAALDVLCSMAVEGRRIALLGEIGELGNLSDELHGYIGAYAAAKPLDILVVVGKKNVDPLVEAALTMGFSEDRLIRVEDVSAAVEIIAPLLHEDDLVLVKASRSAGLDLFVKGVLA